MPRHPPCALHNLTTKMLASTLQFSNTTPETTHTRVLPQDPTGASKHPTPPPATHAFHEPHTTQGTVLTQTTSTRAETSASRFTNSSSNQAPPHTGSQPSHPTPPQQKRSVDVKLLLRKEVIQPHLPVRLPCYDFVPIASPTFDHSPPKGLGHGLRVLPTFMT
jgi:hypothetical protein